MRRWTYPCVDLAGVGANHLGDVRLHDGLELGLVRDGGHPGGQLAVPDGGVAAHELAVCAGEVDEEVGAGQRELALGALSGIPLHAAGC